MLRYAVSHTSSGPVSQAVIAGTASLRLGHAARVCSSSIVADSQSLALASVSKRWTSTSSNNRSQTGRYPRPSRHSNPRTATSPTSHNARSSYSSSSASASSSSSPSSSGSTSSSSFPSRTGKNVNLSLAGVVQNFMEKHDVPLPHEPIVAENIEPPPQFNAPVARLSSALRSVIEKEGVVALGDLTDLPEPITTFPTAVAQPSDIDWERVHPFVTSSRDPALHKLATESGARFMMSTSSSTPMLCQLHYALTKFMPVHVNSLSHWFLSLPRTHTRAAVKPSSSVLRARGPSLWGIDNIPSGSPKSNQILIDLGKSLEKQLTMEPAEFQRLMLIKRDEEGRAIPHEESEIDVDPSRDAYHFVKMNSMLLRSQLDCQDSAVKGQKKVFDLKTRATLPIRLDVTNYQDYLEYRLLRKLGLFSSFEREWFDMARSAFLKYAFQCRIGDMAGIFVAYHNTQHIFGCEYIPLSKMDESSYGSVELADKVYNQVLRLLELILLRVVQDHGRAESGNDSLRMTLKAYPERCEIFVERLPPIEGVPPEAFHSHHQAALQEGPRMPEEVLALIERTLEDAHAGPLYVDLLSTTVVRQLLESREMVSTGPRGYICSRLEDSVAPGEMKKTMPTKKYIESLVTRGLVHVYELNVDVLVSGHRARSLAGFKKNDSLDVMHSLKAVSMRPGELADKYLAALHEANLVEEEMVVVEQDGLIKNADDLQEVLPGSAAAASAAAANSTGSASTTNAAGQTGNGNGNGSDQKEGATADTARRRRVLEILEDHKRFEEYYFQTGQLMQRMANRRSGNGNGNGNGYGNGYGGARGSFHQQGGH